MMTAAISLFVRFYPLIKTRIKKILFTYERKKKIIYAQMHLQYFNEYYPDVTPQYIV